MKHLVLFENFNPVNNIYHSTDIDAFYFIIMNNVLGGLTHQEINGVMVNGISCTKDKNFNYKNKDIVLELDYSLIKKKYKCVDVNFFDTDFGKKKTIEYNLKIEDEKEIFIITDELIPLSKKLISIKLNENVVLHEDIKEMLEINFNNIKIFNYKNKDITNTIIKNKGNIGYDYTDIISGFDDNDLY